MITLRTLDSSARPSRDSATVGFVRALTARDEVCEFERVVDARAIALPVAA